MMKPALSFKQPNIPKSWYKLPNGELTVASINSALSLWWPKLFGYHLLKIGNLSAEIDCEQSTIKHQLCISELVTSADVIADIDDLPFLEHSVDVCLLSHALEFCLDPHHLVREANRVLIPNGHLVLTGYNPFSLAGLNKLIPYRRNQTPWSERFFSPMRVKDWLQLMGYEILADQRILHCSLASKQSPNKINTACQRFAEKYLPSLGSVYIIVAKKRVLPLTPIKPKWKVGPRFSPVKVSAVNHAQGDSIKAKTSKGVVQ